MNEQLNNPASLTVEFYNHCAKALKYSDRQIGELVGLTRQGVFAWKIRQRPGVVYWSPRSVAKQAFPWKGLVRGKHNGNNACKRLHDHGEYKATGGDGMSEEKLRKLVGWYNHMEDYVLEYDPTFKPGVTSGGWIYRPRSAGDGHSLIRLNQYSRTDLTDEDLMVWEFPAERPKPRWSV